MYAGQEASGSVSGASGAPLCAQNTSLNSPVWWRSSTVAERWVSSFSGTRQMRATSPAVYVRARYQRMPGLRSAAANNHIVWWAYRPRERRRLENRSCPVTIYARDVTCQVKNRCLGYTQPLPLRLAHQGRAEGTMAILAGGPSGQRRPPLCAVECNVARAACHVLTKHSHSQLVARAGLCSVRGFSWEQPARGSVLTRALWRYRGCECF